MTMRYLLISMAVIAALTGFSCSRKQPAPQQPAPAQPAAAEPTVPATDVPVVPGMTAEDVRYRDEVRTAPAPGALPF